jgi:hypothetical protein
VSRGQFVGERHDDWKFSRGRVRIGRMRSDDNPGSAVVIVRGQVFGAMNG